MNLFQAVRVATVAMLFSLCMLPIYSVAQCKPTIRIDNALTVVDVNDPFGINLPVWLKEGQTISVASSVKSISILEFEVNDAGLEFSQVLNITSTSPQQVPDGRAWKVESVIKENNSSSYKSANFSTVGTFTWKVPGCAEQICIEAWGAGGGGGGGSYSSSAWRTGAGGGGGGFGSECFNVVPGTVYTVIVGGGGTGGQAINPTGTAGTAGGNSSVGSLITATGGAGGTASASGGSGGLGGSSTAASNADGANGLNGNSNVMSGSGGAGANGGAGGPGTTSSTSAIAGTGPGGGGAGGSPGGYSGARGADGRVLITW